MVEDDAVIQKNLGDFLTAEGFEVISASGQKTAELLIGFTEFDIALLDISLSDGDGFSACKVLKEKNIPVIFLTASDDEKSIVDGLDMGGDDYVVKPFRPRELLSRIRSVLRRYGDNGKDIKIGENVFVDTAKGSVFKNGNEIFLSALEYKLLLVFITNRGKLLSRNMLLEEIWDIAGDFVNDNTLTVYIKRLREKIEDNPQNPVMIKTVRGLGYRLEK